MHIHPDNIGSDTDCNKNWQRQNNFMHSSCRIPNTLVDGNWMVVCTFPGGKKINPRIRGFSYFPCIENVSKNTLRH